ncbi:hypothetical protein AAFF_G00248000 [Aldrovandia affinis]|uniref:PiggyBac transposable element-derived protein domain-containing protein n=1 Tax=Aldrovandia affinis TaxID=143900 RepID=A0AAD7RDJ5_9TELE|nr:hypothetical protein AAFF_G00248000 [Aldrovandia affinis]
MGRIDLSDMLVHLYKSPAKSRRWYFPLFGYILDLSVSNARLVYKRDCGLRKEKAMPLKRFRLAVARSLAQDSPPPHQRPVSLVRGTTPRQPNNHHQMCAMTTVDICHFTVRTGAVPVLSKGCVQM